MLSIFYILHHCNMFQRLGGSFPHPTLVRCPYLPAADSLVHHVQPGVLCQAAGWEPSFSSPSVLGIPSTAQGTALVADHLTKKFPVMQRRPELPFPLLSLPGIASRAPGAGDNTALPGLSPQTGSPKLCATA